MAARLKRDIERCARGSPVRRPQRLDFGMRAAVTLVPAFAQYRCISSDNAAHQRIRLDEPLPPSRKRKSSPHAGAIEVCELVGASHTASLRGVWVFPCS